MKKITLSQDWVAFMAWLRDDYISACEGVARREPRPLSQKSLLNIHIEPKPSSCFYCSPVSAPVSCVIFACAKTIEGRTSCTTWNPTMVMHKMQDVIDVFTYFARDFTEPTERALAWVLWAFFAHSPDIGLKLKGEYPVFWWIRRTVFD